MKTSIQQDSRQGKYRRYTQESLSVKDAITWFIITVIALCLAGTSQAGTRKAFNNLSPVPQAFDITMTPVVQITTLWPLQASSQTSVIGSYTLMSLPQPSQGKLYIEMNGELMEASEGMMITADLADKLVFEPDTLFNGDATFSYSAADEQGYSSNTAIYTIPVIAKQHAILPVTLLNFSGAATGKKVQLNWQTEHEGNCSHFEIQRSINGAQFESIGVVTAKGNTSTVSEYATNDDLFFFNCTKVQYRIKMININGSFVYSRTIDVKLNGPVKNDITAWPIPFSSNLTISFSSEQSAPVTITINSINGNSLIKMNANATKGINTIDLYQAQNLPAGTYLVTLDKGSGRETIKVVKH